MIVTITLNPAVDKSTTIDKLIPEKKLRCSEMVVEAGGGGINVSKAIKKLGGQSLAIFPSGGVNGSVLEKSLTQLGIDFQPIPEEAETRENIVVTETSTNAQYRFVLPGAPVSQNMLAQIESSLKALAEKPSTIIASGSLPPGVDNDFYARLARIANEMKCRFILDTSGEPLELALKEGLFLIKPNLHELSMLAGKKHLELNEVDDAAMEIIKSGRCEIIIVSLGPSGALLVTKQGYEHVPAPSVRKLSTVGAGDSMVAGIAWMIEQGKSWKESVRFGVACGTASTMNPGTHLFDVDSVQQLYNWINRYAEKYKLSLENE
jgi:6-phosphofructokinase 2